MENTLIYFSLSPLCEIKNLTNLPNLIPMSILNILQKGYWGLFVEHPSQTLEGQHGVTKLKVDAFIFVVFVMLMSNFEVPHNTKAGFFCT
jgi:hypothetical protein